MSRARTPSRELSASAAKRGPRGRRSRSGFTLVEVMMAIMLLLLGLMGMVALQIHLVRANSFARQSSTATQIAQLWIERIKQDATMWTLAADPGGAPTATAVLANTLYLNRITGAANVWQSIPNTTPAISNAFDVSGSDVANNATPTSDPTYYPHYCASYRLGWVYFGRAIRADVRVWWPRQSAGGATYRDFPLCNDDGIRLDPGGAMVQRYHVHYQSTVVRLTDLRR